MSIRATIRARLGKALRSLVWNNQNVDSIFGLNTASASGVPVSDLGALSNPSLLSGIRLISETIAAFPLRVMFEDDVGNRQPDKTHPLFNILLNSPNERFTTFTFIQTLLVHCFLYGNAYVQIIWGRKGQVNGLELLYPPATVEFGSGDDDFYMTWIKDGPMSAGRYVKLLPYEVIKIPFIIMQNFFKGHGLLELSRDPIGLALAIDGFAASYYRNNATTGGVFEADKNLTEDQKQRFKEALRQYSQGVNNAYLPFILPMGMKYSRTANNPQESQSVEMMEFEVEQVARILRIPPKLLGSRIKESKSSESDSIDFLKYCILPVVRRIEQAFNSKLFIGTERDSYYVQFDFKELLRTDSLTLRQSLAIDRQNGAINGNEWRAQIGLPPVVDPFMDKYLVLSNMGGVQYQGNADGIQGQILQTEELDDEETTKQ